MSRVTTALSACKLLSAVLIAAAMIAMITSVASSSPAGPSSSGRWRLSTTTMI